MHQENEAVGDSLFEADDEADEDDELKDAEDVGYGVADGDAVEGLDNGGGVVWSGEFVDYPDDKGDEDAESGEE